MKQTKQRTIMLDELKKVVTHPTADEIYLMVRKKIPNISLGTVYRNLKILRDSGEILELSYDNFNRYDGDTSLHSHFTCDKCRKVYDLEEPVDSDFDKKVSKDTGFNIFSHRIEFFGICKNCRG